MSSSPSLTSVLLSEPDILERSPVGAGGVTQDISRSIPIFTNQEFCAEILKVISGFSMSYLQPSQTPPDRQGVAPLISS